MHMLCIIAKFMCIYRREQQFHDPSHTCCPALILLFSVLVTLASFVLSIPPPTLCLPALRLDYFKTVPS